MIPRWLTQQHCKYPRNRKHYHYSHYSPSLLCCFTHCWSSGWWCGTLLHCEEETCSGCEARTHSGLQSAEWRTWSKVWSYWKSWELRSEGECCLYFLCAALKVEKTYNHSMMINNVTIASSLFVLFPLCKDFFLYMLKCVMNFIYTPFRCLNLVFSHCLIHSYW